MCGYTRMDNPYYACRPGLDDDINIGTGNKYTRINNMEMDMEEKLISDPRRRFLAKNWKWIYAIVGVATGCILTIGISYMFFSLGKSKGQGNVQSNGKFFTSEC